MYNQEEILRMPDGPWNWEDQTEIAVSQLVKKMRELEKRIQQVEETISKIQKQEET